MGLGNDALLDGSPDRARQGSLDLRVRRTLVVQSSTAYLSVWTKYTLAAIPGSFLFTMVALPLYAIIAPLLNFSMPYQGIVARLWGDAAFYFMLLAFPMICLLRDYVWK